MSIAVEEEPWMLQMEDRYYGDESIQGSRLEHPHYMRYEPFKRLIENEPEEIMRLKLKTNSMLSRHTLTLIHHLAQHSQGSILELGAFTGGATVAAGLGLAASGRGSPMISVEGGRVAGGNWAAGDVNANNVFDRLNENIAHFELSPLVQTVEGISRSHEVVEKVVPVLEQDPVGLLIIDADGHVKEDLDTFMKVLRPDAFIVVDDYTMHSMHSGGYELKSGYTQKAIHDLVNSGQAISLGLYLWGTWFGRFRA